MGDREAPPRPVQLILGDEALQNILLLIPAAPFSLNHALSVPEGCPGCVLTPERETKSRPPRAVTTTPRFPPEHRQLPQRIPERCPLAVPIPLPVLSPSPVAGWARQAPIDRG